jgi:hypothetical protein
LDEAAIAAGYTKKRQEGAGQSRWRDQRVISENVMARHLRKLPSTSGVRHLRRAAPRCRDIPGLDADHAVPGGVAEIDHGGGLFNTGRLKLRARACVLKSAVVSDEEIASRISNLASSSGESART